MYSIVLMAATTAGPTTPAADHTPAPVAVAAPVAVGCCGGSVVAGCTGYVASCYGSCYGGCHGGRGGLFHRHKHSCNGCSGCYGGCSGWSCFGSCYGSYAHASWGSCYGSYSYGAWGSCYGSYSHGCWGSGYGYGGYVAPAAPAVVIPVERPAAPANPAPKTDTTPKSDATKTSASLRFQLPPAAVLYVDGQRAAGTGAERAFYTPPLQAGQRYFYDVRAELVVNGQTVTEERRVVVSAGADLVESFPRLSAAASDPATVAGR